MVAIFSIILSTSSFCANAATSGALIHVSGVEIATGEVYDLTTNQESSNTIYGLSNSTIIIRYKSTSSATYQSLFSVSNSTLGNENRHFHIYVTPSGTLGMELRNTDSDFKYTMSAPSVLNSEDENIIAFSADSITGTYKLFANGSLVSTLNKNEFKFLKDIDGLDKVSLGGTIRGGKVKYPFSGTISDFTIYGSCMSDADIITATSAQENITPSNSVNFTKENLSIQQGTTYDLSSIQEAESIRSMSEGTIIVRYTSDSTASIQSLFSVSNSTTGNENRHFHIYITPSGSLGFELRNTDSDFKYAASRASSVRSTYQGSNAENTVAFVANKSDGSYKLFANGQLVKEYRTNNYKFIPDITGADTISLGATVRGGTPKYTFGGDIESFTITSDVLSDEQLIQTTGFNSYGTLIFSDQDATNSNYFRIPSLLKLSNGTIVAAADARYGGTHDSKSNIDTAFSSSNDNGITWSTPILPLHFTDYEDQRVDWPTTMPERNLQITGSASFIDPLLIQDASTGRLFLFADVMPAGIGSSNASIGNGYKEIDGNKYLKLRWHTDASDTYNYSVRADGVIYDDKTNSPTDYKLNDEYEILKNGVPLTVKQYKVNINGSTLNEINTNQDVAMNVFYKDAVFKVFPTTYLGMKYSDNGGQTWSGLHLLNELKSSAEKILVTGPGVGIQIQNGDYAGRLVVPVYSVTLSGFGIVYSDNHGATWNYAAADNFSNGSTAEAQIVEMADGSLKAFIRTNTGHIIERNSIDGGITWSTGTALTNVLSTGYGTQLSVIRYSGQIDGHDAIIMSTPNSTSGRNTGVINVGLITDTGATGLNRYNVDWKYSYRVNGNGGFSYSCLSQLSDGNIGLFYEGYDSWSREQLHLKNVVVFEKYTMNTLTGR